MSLTLRYQNIQCSRWSHFRLTCWSIELLPTTIKDIYNDIYLWYWWLYEIRYSSLASQPSNNMKYFHLSKNNPVTNTNTKIHKEARQNLWVIPGRYNLKIEVTKNSIAVYNSREKRVIPIQIIDEKSTDPIQKFYAEGTNSTGHTANEDVQGISSVQMRDIVKFWERGEPVKATFEWIITLINISLKSH